MTVSDDRCAPDDRWAGLVASLGEERGVTRPEPGAPQRFGAAALKVHGSIFAMVRGGRLVLKLPRDRVAALVAKGTGTPFSSGGRTMGGWVTVGDDADWPGLAREALAFVAGLPR